MATKTLTIYATEVAHGVLNENGKQKLLSLGLSDAAVKLIESGDPIFTHLGGHHDANEDVIFDESATFKVPLIHLPVIGSISETVTAEITGEIV